MLGGVVAAVLSPRAIYAMGGILGVAVAVAIGVCCADRAPAPRPGAIPPSEEPVAD